VLNWVDIGPTYAYVYIYECFDAFCNNKNLIMQQNGGISSDIFFSVKTGLMKMVFTTTERWEATGFVAAWSVNFNNTCIACPDNTYSSAGAYSCQNCPLFSKTDSIRTGSIKDCKCIPGYQGQDGMPCTTCPVNTYKNLLGNSSCLICDNSTLYTPAGSNICVCATGRESLGKSCVDCIPGKYIGTNSDLATASVCSNCAAGTYSIAAASVCSTCLAGSFSLATA